MPEDLPGVGTQIGRRLAQRRIQFAQPRADHNGHQRNIEHDVSQNDRSETERHLEHHEKQHQRHAHHHLRNDERQHQPALDDLLPAKRHTLHAECHQPAQQSRADGRDHGNEQAVRGRSQQRLVMPEGGIPLEGRPPPGHRQVGGIERIEHEHKNGAVEKQHRQTAHEAQAGRSSPHRPSNGPAVRAAWR